MKRLTIRVLVVDDYEPWRRFISTSLQAKPELQIIGEASDGLEAVQRAQKLQPDLILLDIGLPTLNGIEVARQIRHLSPESKILFVSENRFWTIAEEALRSGGNGYLIKSDAGIDLLRAVEAVLKGKQFISSSLAGRDFDDPTDQYTADIPHHQNVVAPIQNQNIEIACRHEAGFYSDDRSLLNGLTQFIGASLKIGNAAIVVATGSHREAAYQLQGDTSKLSKHVGHEVEIKGTTSGSNSAAAPSSATNPGTISTSTAGASQTINVDKVKHISNTCTNASK